jgi:hypothetical protein
MLMPAGSVPALIAHVYGDVPPVAASDWEYVEPTTAGGSVAVVTESAPVIVSV